MIKKIILLTAAITALFVQAAFAATAVPVYTLTVPESVSRGDIFNATVTIKSAAAPGVDYSADAGEYKLTGAMFKLTFPADDLEMVNAPQLASAISSSGLSITDYYVVGGEFHAGRAVGAIALARELQLLRLGAHDVDDAREALEIVLPGGRQVVVEQKQHVARKLREVRRPHDRRLGGQGRARFRVRKKGEVVEPPEEIVEALQTGPLRPPEREREPALVDRAGHKRRIGEAIGNVVVEVDFLHLVIIA